MSCRTALMEFLGHCQSPEVIEVIPCSLTSGQASANPEQDISHLQLLSNQLLESPQPDGALQVGVFISSCSHYFVSVWKLKLLYTCHSHIVGGFI